jgi:hypothetical protein
MKTNFVALVGISLLLVTQAGAAEPTMNGSSIKKTPMEVVQHHIDALKANDVEALVSDYADDAVVVIPVGVFSGTAQVRKLFEIITDKKTRPEIVSMIAAPVSGSDDLIEETYTLKFPDGRVAKDQRDIIVVRDGKIVFHTGRH